jgi:hypothetical protein
MVSMQCSMCGAHGSSMCWSCIAWFRSYIIGKVTLSVWQCLHVPGAPVLKGTRGPKVLFLTGSLLSVYNHEMPTMRWHCAPGNGGLRWETFDRSLIIVRSACKQNIRSSSSCTSTKRLLNISWHYIPVAKFGPSYEDKQWHSTPLKLLSLGLYTTLMGPCWQELRTP